MKKCRIPGFFNEANIGSNESKVSSKQREEKLREREG
jgi:hypothetical protein